MSINKYEPHSHFFIDHTNLSDPSPANLAADAFGPVNGDETNKYRTTSFIRASTASKVFAICDGHILIQPYDGDTTKVNLILKPTATYSPLKIKYFIYRGVDIDDLIFGFDVAQQTPDSPEFIKRVWEASNSLAEALDQPLPSNLDAKFIGYDPGLSDDELLSYVFYGGGTVDFNLYNIPKCFKGELIGNFTDRIGLEIVLDYGDYELDYEEQFFKLDLEYARKPEHIFDVSTITGAVQQKRYREYIHQFIDAAAFWGSHIDCGEISLYNDSTITNTSDIYDTLVSKYQTANKLYLYIQSERGRSYNFYGSNGQISFDEQGTSTPNLVDYQTDNWPIIIEDILNSSTEIKEFQFSFNYNIDTTIHETDINISIYVIFPNWILDNFITTNNLYDPAFRNGQSKLIENIPVKSIEDSGNYNTISNFLITTALAHQPDLNNTESLWLANMKSLFESVSPPSNNLYVWASKIDSQTNINLLGFNIKNSVISTTVYQDYGKNNIGATEKRLLYKVAVLDTIEAYKDIISSDVKSSFEEGINYNNYGLTLYSDTNFRIYKGDIDDNGNLIDVLSLRNEKDIKKNLIFIQLGILEKEYNLLFYDSETIPDTSAPGYVPFLTNPARIYFHLDEETVPAGSGFQKFKLGLKYEDETGILITSFPTNDIFVYTIDGFFFFSNRYSEHQEFFENFPKCKINFRVESPYVGEFGFDWMRIGDTAAPGDVDYENNVGKLYNPGPPPTIVTNPNQDTGTFILHPELFKKLEFEYFPFPVQFDSSNLVEKYYVPVLTIYPPYVPIVPPGVDLDRQPIFIPPYNDDINRVAKLTLDIVVTEEPVSMKLEYDDTIFDITPIVIPKTVGTHTLNITVKCFKEFGTEQYIKALAYYNNSSGVLDSLGKTVGIIRVKPNTKQLRGAKKTIFIAIRTNINGVDNIPSLPDKAPFMMKYLRQILITPIFEVFELDMRTNGTFNSDYVRFDGGTNKVIIQDQTNPGLTYLGNFLYSEFTSMNIPGTTIPIGSIYDLDKRLFFIEESGGSINSAGNYVGLNGAAAGNNIIGFSTANNSTASHEFLHSANLPHSFTAYEASSYAKFTYRPLVTDNIMDYSHKVGINRVSLWDWQGKIANSSSDREP